MVIRVCDAEDVSDIVRRPQRVAVLERGSTPDLEGQHSFFDLIHATYVHDRICGTRKEQRLVLRQAESEDAPFVRMDDSPAFVRVEAVYLA